MKEKLTWPIFWVLVGTFAVLLLLFIAAAVDWIVLDVAAAPILTLIAFQFLVLGPALVVFTVKENVAGLLRRCLVLIGVVSIFIALSFGCILFPFAPRTIIDKILYVFYISLAVFLVGIVGTVTLAIKTKLSDKKNLRG